MKAVRDLWGQMVEKRLWPVALVLVAALVAVPLVLAESPGPGAEDAAGTDAPPVAAAAAAADLRDPDEPVVSVASETVEGVPLRGRAKNPFKQQHVPKPQDGDGGILLVVPGADGGLPPDGSGETPTTPDGEDEQPRETFTYASIDVRFGRAGSPLREIRDVPRLTPLPQASNPIVIFLGMRGDHETALFMVSTDVHAQGEGSCVPSPRLCEAIELREGDIALLDYRADDGSIVQYELDLVAVELHETTSEGKASRTIARSSRADAEAGADDELGRAGTTRVVPQASAGTAAGAADLTPLP